MNFAQNTYSQKLGINGRYSIASSGCFLTSFCNLESGFDKPVDPLTLNNWFVSHGTYIDIDDGIRDDLGWSSITQYDPSIQVAQTVDHGISQTAGWPNTNNAIVRFYYRSIETGQMIFHFCKVADYGSRLILDSWDGKVKSSPYGDPTAWATYTNIAPVAVAPTPPPRTPKDYMTYTPVTEPTILRTTLSPTSWWNLSNDSTDPGGFHPAATLNQYTPVAIGGYAVNSHFASNTYAMIPEDFARAVAGDYSTNNGINTRDLEAIPPPPKTTPSAPIKGTPVETYALVTNVSCFDTSGQASMHKGVAKTLGTGIYIIWSKDDRNNMLNLTDDNMKNKNWWVNPNDNVLPAIEIKPEEPKHVPIPTLEPTPVPVKVESTPPVVSLPVPPPPVKLNPNQWKASYKPFHPKSPLIPVKYVAIQDFVLRDLDGKRPDLRIFEDKEFGLYGSFIGPDNKYYLRAKTNGDVAFEYWYGVPMQHPEGGVGYVVPSGLLEIFPKPVQHWYVAGVATAEKAIDIVWTTLTKRKAKK